MPLFIDFHELDDFTDNTLEELRQGHKLDLAVQSKYNVEYKHYYISKENRKAFCVMEGPDKESCEAVHREAHGLVACNIVEVELNKYGAILGLVRADPDGINLHDDGTIDSGFRTILFISTLIATLTRQTETVDLLQSLNNYTGQLRDIVTGHGGRDLTVGKSEVTYAFTSCTDAMRCSIALQKKINQMNSQLHYKKLKVETRIVLDAGEPVTRNDTFFGDTLQLARRLSHRGQDGDIVISSCVNEHSQPRTNNRRIKISSMEEERFINRVMTILESKLTDDDFNVIQLSEQAGISRPQLYRKISNLFEKSPNHLINEMRLREAVRLIHKEFGNIAEVAYAVGFNNPSYFAKCFQRRFGMQPSFYSTQQHPTRVSNRA